MATPASVAPTLIVGLGGIGSKITARVFEKLKDERQRERINFVVIDTDINELGEIKRKYPFVKTVQTSTNMTVGDYLHLDVFTRDNSFPVNPHLYRKTLSEGAGQVRAISHLAFVTAMKRGFLNELDNAIYDLYKLENVPTTQVLRVIIVSSLAGGTGSGLILPVSMYIKQFLKTKIQIPGSITRGFFILPEILYSSITSESQRNALKANAYAVLRELNAFILKADDNLPPRYKDKVHLMFPKVGTNDFEEYDVLPMDFSFMFDAQNIEGKKLNSTEQYYDHAATCIYAQSIGPMNTRSNSSEDNVIRALVSGQSRNRYAGAGASELRYPSDHILRYIALRWAKQSVSESWMVFDHDYKTKKKENERDKLKGNSVDEIDQAKEYINSVDSAASNGNTFAIFTRNLSYNIDKDGFTELGNKWNKYLVALEDYVKEINIKSSEIEDSQRTAKSAVDGLNIKEGENFTDDFANAYASLRKYKDLVSRRVGELGRRYAHALFKFTDSDDSAKGRPTQIETYMKDNSQEFMHPNAARYFLYQTLQAIKKKLNEVRKRKEEQEETIKDFDKLFDDRGTTDKVEVISDFTRKIDEGGLLARLTKKYNGKINEYLDHYQSILGTIAEYRVTAPYFTILTEAQNFLEGLCKSFADFYNAFESNVREIERQINTLEEKYSLKKGNAIRYVCTSKKCLEKFYEKMQFSGSSMQISGELCQRIYSQVKLHSRSPDINKEGSFFKDIFDNEIIGHFEKTVMQTYSTDIKMDIIRALEVEAEYDQDIRERSLIEEHVKKVIKETKKLSDPFINRPLGEEAVPIPACAFNRKLYADDPARKTLVNSELKSFGGVECSDEEIDMETILFYSAIYGLFPSDLLKFAPAKKGATVMLEAGEYNKAYFDMIGRIEPNTLTTPVITPHLHKKWHLISEMPDLSDEEQQKQEKTIYKALVLGILYGLIMYERVGEKCKYSLKLKDSIKEIPLDTSNGTPCDRFYEIADALTINPVIVRKILNAVDAKLEAERNNNIVKFTDSDLKKGIEELKLFELSGDERTMSIFGIAAAFKVTMPPHEFILDQGLMLLETILETLHDQVELLCPENERGKAYVGLIEDQLDLFTGKNFDLYKEKYPSVIDDYMRMLFQVVINVLDRKGYGEAAEKVNKRSKHYFSGSGQIAPQNTPSK